MDIIFEFFFELFFELLLEFTNSHKKNAPKSLKVVAVVVSVVVQLLVFFSFVIGFFMIFDDKDMRGLVLIAVSVALIIVEILLGIMLSKRRGRIYLNMKELTIYGKNRTEHKNTREGCRAIIIMDEKILLSVEERTGLHMLPGGGVEDGETYPDCCRREILEETGYEVSTKDCFLKLSEYYFDYLFINYYFVCQIVGEGARCLTDLEKERGLQAKWVDIDEAIDLFSRHEEWAEIDEDRRGTYEREYTALCEYVSYMAKQREKK